MLSNAFSKSTKLMNSSLCHSMHCSIMFLSVKIWSIHPLPCLKPACSSLSLPSTALLMRLITILARTLLGIDSSVIPRQLLQSLNVPFLGILIITPSFQSSGISFLFHAVVNNGSKIWHRRREVNNLGLATHYQKSSYTFRALGYWTSGTIHKEALEERVSKVNKVLVS